MSGESDYEKNTKSDYLRYLEDRYVEDNNEIKAIFAAAFSDIEKKFSQQQIQLRGQVSDIEKKFAQQQIQLRGQVEEVEKSAVSMRGMLRLAALSGLGTLCALVAFIMFVLSGR